MLLCSIINDLVKESPKERNVVYFFCQATDARLDNAEAVLRGLLYGLRKQEALKKRLVAEYKDAGDQLFEDANHWAALSRILLSTLEDPDLPRTYLVIDGLDECRHNLDKLLSLITQISSSRAKVLVSSRYWPEIEDGLSATAGKVMLRLEMNSDAVSSAVGIYINHKVDELARSKKYSPEQKELVRQHLISNANNTFLWVALICQALGNPRLRKWNTEKTLTAFPPGLDALYDRMARQVFASEDAELCRQVLGLVSLVFQPIRLEEVLSLIEDPALFPDDKVSLRQIVDLCGSFLSLRGELIYFVHQSAKEFLTEKLAPMVSISKVCVPKHDPLLPLRYACVYWAEHLVHGAEAGQVRHIDNGGLVHEFLEQHLLHWLEALSLLKNIWTAISSILKILSAARRSSSQSALTDLLYDAQRLVSHHIGCIELHPLQVYGAALVFSPTRSIVRRLFEEEELQWLSTKPIVGQDWDAHLLSLTHPVWGGLYVFVSFISFYPDGKQLVSLTSDGTVRVWNSLTGQCQSTLQIRDQADRNLITVFYPLVSWSLSTGSMRVVAWVGHGKIRVLDLTTGQKWELRMLEVPVDGHGVPLPPLSIALSPEGKQVAVVDRNHAIQILDLEKEPNRTTLEGLDRVDDGESIAFSPDGRWLAVASEQKLHIWDRKTQKSHCSLESGAQFSCSPAFTPDGSKIGLGCNDGAVQIWDIETRQLQQTLTGNGGLITSMDFLHDGSQVVSTSQDYAIRVWDVVSGHCRRTLRRNTAYKVAFSPDGRHVASIDRTYECVVKVWDITLEQHESMMHSGSGFVSAIAISPDEERVASGSQDGSLRIWSAVTGECQHTLEVHEGVVNSVCFSSRGDSIATGSQDKTIRVWSAMTGQCQKTLRGHQSSIRSAVFSPRGDKELASGSEEGIICLWDIPEGQCQRMLAGHSSPVTSLAFSPDGRQVVSSSFTGTVRVWDTATGCCRWKRIAGRVSSVDFSAGGNLIMACESHMGLIQVLDVATGRPRGYFRGLGPEFWAKASPLSDSPDQSQMINQRLQTNFGVAVSDSSVADGGQPTAKGGTPPIINLYRNKLLGIGIDHYLSILKNGMPMLQLPAEYKRVYPAYFLDRAAISGNTLAIGVSSTVVLIFRIGA